MSTKCICDTPNQELKNTHYLNRNISLTVVRDAWGYGAVLFENHSVIAVFNIDHCPKCGKKLDESKFKK